jgi:hypothetical protein
MTLAAIILLSILGSSQLVASQNQAPSQAPSSNGAPAAQKADSQKPDQGPDQSGKPPQSTPEATPAAPPKKPPSNQKSRAASVHARSKNKPTPPDCDPASANSASPSSTGSKLPQRNAPGELNSPAKAPTNCPPKKIIVRQGGTTEPSIELAGAASDDQAARERDAVEQMVAVTENNLKNISGQTMSSSRKDQVNQIRQYLTESKGAVADGDLDRARTLAWKAQMLSEDLVKSESNK